MKHFDQQLGHWLSVAGLPSFQADTTVSPVLKLAFERFSWPSTQAFLRDIDINLLQAERMNVIGYPNLVIAEYYQDKIKELMNLYGVNLHANVRQKPLLDNTNLSEHIVYDDCKTANIIPGYDSLTVEDWAEFHKGINPSHRQQYNLQHDSAFQLMLKTLEVLHSSGSESAVLNWCVAVAMHLHLPIERTINQFMNEKYDKLPEFMEVIFNHAKNDEPFQLEALMSDFVSPTSLIPSRLSLLKEKYQDMPCW
jgi:hypothetical protein